jgi:hypothetical protein
LTSSSPALALGGTPAMASRFPASLRAWLWCERKLYGDPISGLDREGPLEAPLVALYDGGRDVRALWTALLLRRTPTIEIVGVVAGGEGRLLASSRVAIPEKEFFGRSLAICLGRRRSLAERARRRWEERSDAGTRAIPAPTERRGPSPLLVLLFALRHVLQKARNQLLKRFVHLDHWSIAFQRLPGGADAVQPDPLRLFQKPERWVTMPSRRDGFYADPFLWPEGSGHLHMFFEDLSFETNRGVIRHVAMDAADRGDALRPVTALERPYHLSYPFLFQHEGSVYMIPETSANRTIEAYRADPFPATWLPHQVLMNDVLAVDTTLHHDGDTWWMFTSIAEEGGSTWDELSLFYADGPFGPWQPHPMNPIVSDCRCARMAGNLFRDAAGRLIRPAQDCERSYGAALVFCEVVECSKTSYAERIVLRQEPPRGRQGIHTWNVGGGWAVIDLKRARWRWGRPMTRAARPPR